MSILIPTIIRLHSFKRPVLTMERLVFVVRQALDFYTLGTPNVYFRRFCHIDLNISGVKVKLKSKTVKYNNNKIKQKYLPNISEIRILLSVPRLIIMYTPA